MIYVPDYSPYVQYSITIIIFLYSLLTLKQIKFAGIVLFLLVLLFGVISFTIGILKELAVNPRAIAVPILFLITINSKSYKLLKPLFIYCLLITIIEILLGLTGLHFWGILTRLGLPRLHGGFLDIHLNGIFLCTCLYIFGHKYIGGIISLLTVSLQTPIAYSVVFMNKRNIKFCIFFLVILFYLLYIVGHLKSDQKSSMLEAYLSIGNSEFSDCYLLGCSSIYLQIGQSKKKVAGLQADYYEDVGFTKVFYFFGIPWFIFYTLLVFRFSKSKIIPLIYFLSILHFPVVFGVVTTCLLAVSINYYNRKYYNRSLILHRTTPGFSHGRN